MKIIFEKKKTGDRCTRIAKRKYDVWPSAYASGAVVKCRQGKIWKGLSEEQLTEEILNIISEELEFFLEKKKKKPDFKKEKESSLNGWFSRQGGKGKSKGWVDCNTCRTDKETGKKTCKTCGRQEGEKRAKYPACRPKPSDCDSSGKGTEWGKKSESVELEEGLLEEDKQYLKNIVISELHKLFEVEQSSNEDKKKEQADRIKNAEAARKSAEGNLRAANAEKSSPAAKDDPAVNKIANAQKRFRQAEVDRAKKDEQEIKKMAQENPVTEQKNNSGINGMKNLLQEFRKNVLEEAEEGRYGKYLKFIEEDTFLVIKSLMLIEEDRLPETVVKSLQKIKNIESYSLKNAEKIRKDFQNFRYSLELRSQNNRAEDMIQHNVQDLTNYFRDTTIHKKLSEILVIMGLDYQETKEIIKFIDAGNPEPGVPRRFFIDDDENEIGEEDIAPLEKPSPNKTVTDRAGKKQAISEPESEEQITPEDSMLAAYREKAKGNKTQP